MQTPQRFHQALRFILSIAMALLASTISAEPERFKAADSEGVTATRQGNLLYLEVAAGVKGPVSIPRLAAPVASMMWQGSITEDGVSLKPEPDRWVISWKNRPAEDAALVLQFGSAPLLMDEVKPISQSSDGSFYLPAHLATTFGDKIRYEPQPHKNTVGFWTGKDNSATWSIQLDKPGTFNVAVLQGCGRGQGGSQAILICHEPKGEAFATLNFVVKETGHFQNFQWRDLGTVELPKAGEVNVKVRPIRIKKAALMDIRAIHLIRLPDKKK